MSSSGSNAVYTSTARLLHWLVAGLIVVQFVLANLAEDAAVADAAVRQLALLANHKSVGITILVLILFRLIWRYRHPAPALPAAMPRWQVLASRASHWSLYGILLAMPVSGWLMSSASAYSVSWFNLFQLPDLISANPDSKETLQGIHEVLSKMLFAIASLHILAALKHALVNKDSVLQRMASTTGLIVFAVIIAVGASVLGNVDKSPSSESVRTTVEPGDVTAASSAAIDSDLPLWQIDFDASHIKFIGVQAGAEFEGVWQSWTAIIRFSGDNLGAGVFDITIETVAVATQDDERDFALADPEWFDSFNTPEAYYRARNFSANADGSFSADGHLIVKGFASPVVFQFSVEEIGEQRILVGSAELDRLALGVGTGEWEDTESIGRMVLVDVRVEASIATRATDGET